MYHIDCCVIPNVKLQPFLSHISLICFFPRPRTHTAVIFKDLEVATRFVNLRMAVIIMIGNNFNSDCIEMHKTYLSSDDSGCIS